MKQRIKISKDSVMKVVSTKQYTCDECFIRGDGDAPFSIIRHPMPSFCSMECLDASEAKRKGA